MDRQNPTNKSTARLKKRADFVALRKGARQSGSLFTVQAGMRRDGDQEDAARIGFTVTKKTGNSVMRSRIKRRLRAAAGICEMQGLFTQGVDYAVIARGGVINVDFDRLTHELGNAIERATRKLKSR
jgi:ribonuclease P protein component